MDRLVAAFAAATITVAVVGAQGALPDDWPAVTARIDRAVIEGSATGLKSVREDLVRRASASPSLRHPPLIDYAIAYTAWRMAFLSRIAAQERDDIVDDAVSRLQTIVNANPRDAEALALLGGLYAAQIGRSPLQAIVRGPRASAALQRATELAPNNPRVALQAGINAFHTPAAFGGGMYKAERLLRRSVDLFAKERSDDPWPNWGRVDAHAWLGQVLARNGDRAAARGEYEQALTIAPDSGWVKYVLLPALERGGR